MKAIALSWGRESIAAIIFSFLLVVSLVVPAFVASKEVHAEEHNGNIVLGYYTSWNPPADLDPSKLTHIIIHLLMYAGMACMEIRIMMK